ncbi:MAG TPA: DUF779 domain-containing protein [Solirubrobacteraceae bacterium]|nr:DUF779 domain-containing protein [Solirubrobacteraceae bacterium]
MTQAVFSTPEALEVIHGLEAEHGPLMFFQSGGCCEGSSPICMRDGELPLSPNDIRLGTIGGVPVYIDAEQYERWGHPAFVLDVEPGAATSLSLEGGRDVHFVTRAPSPSPPVAS